MDNNENPIKEFGTSNIQTEEKVNEQESQEQQNSQSTQSYVQNEQTNQTQQDKKMNSLALGSFICALIGLVVCGLPLGIAAVIMGVNANSSFKPETENNKWMATFGLVLGIIDIICVVFYLFTLNK